MENILGTMMSGVVGISLAASCGFRVFVPMLVMSMAVKSGMLELTDEWNWLGSWPALIAFSMATTTEIGGYYVPWLDNLLDTIASPAAVVAGTITTAACVSEMSPFLQWSTAIIAGGGIAGTIQGTTVFARGASTATTGGLGNPIVSTLELLMSLALSLLAIFVPILAAAVVCVIGFVLIRRFLRQPST